MQGGRVVSYLGWTHMADTILPMSLDLVMFLSVSTERLGPDELHVTALDAAL